MARLFAQAVPTAGQLLQLVSNGKSYRFSILHAEFGTRKKLERGAREHAHAVYHIVLFSQGSNRVLYNGNQIKVSRGTLILSDPGKPHSFSPCLPGEIAYHEVTFELVEKSPLRLPFSDLLSNYSGLKFQPVAMPHQLKSVDARMLEEKFELLLTRLMRNDLFMGYTQLLEIFAFLIDGVYASKSIVLDPLQAVQRTLEMRYHEPLTLHALAEQAQLSPAYLCRAFKKRFGRAPMDYQCELRIRAARNLLLSTNLSCKDIGARVGFCDVYTFSKSFRRKDGRSPSELRKKYNLEHPE